MARNTRTFSDLDFNFGLHPATSDVVTRYDEDAVKQAVKNLILTQNFERPFRSNIGCQVKGLLFEPISPLLTAMIERTISDTIINYEPRVDLISVVVRFSPENNSVYISITFKLKNTETPVNINLILERTR